MGMTLAEKILAAHSGRKEVSPGELINVKVDLVMANDVTAPIAIEQFRKLGVDDVFDKERVVFVPSHFAPAKDIASAAQGKVMRDFARETGIVYYEIGQAGIEHILLPWKGHVVPGDVYCGADSHTPTCGALGAFATGMGSTDVAVAMATGETWMKVPPTMRCIYHGKMRTWTRSKDLILHTIGVIGTDGATYKAMQFEGDALESMSMDARFTMTNMVTEAGGKTGLMRVDDVTLEYVKPRAKRPWTVYEPDPDAEYESTYEFDASAIEPTVALPFSPGNTKTISEVAKDEIKIDQVFIGSCTNARMEDLREAAEIMRGRKVAPWVRCIVIPATQDIFLEALKEGLIEVFTESGCQVSAATCGPCLGGYYGVLGEGEKCVSTSNRNFPGRMGHPKGEAFLVNPPLAAAAAIAGRIVHPDEVAGKVAV
ncbi:MAG: 3-isopropylmalate dehydratase large subunit [Dehalococcoidia bacterium]|nr:3-isopropylmalate dehydratase large subunit [Dehalococcoidia bacterium]MDZ4277719.1 3-isopropylmalate dehydratase large subunit [Dehalococcoidia bacterium]